MTELTSRERMLRALKHEQPDHIPCSFMSFTALRKRCQEDLYELVKAERALGLDSFLFIPSTPRPLRPEHPELRGLPVRFHPAVTTREWRENLPNALPIMHKEYTTPGGKLQTSVRLSDVWPHGDHIPFMDDFQVPAAIKPLVTEPRDLEALQFMLAPPQPGDVAAFQREVEKAKAFVKELGVLLAGGWGVDSDMANWLCGVAALTMLAINQPAFVTDLLEMIHAWDMKRMQVVLSAPVDLYIYRAWYEGCDFVRPKFFRQTILPRLKEAVALAHNRGAMFGYICTSGTQPMLDMYLEAGIDVLIGIDPVQGTYTDMDLMKSKIGERICLWGGLSGAITVEQGTAEEVRAAVKLAVEKLGPRGFILSPIDNLTLDTPRTWENVDVLIDEWRRLR